MREFSHPNAHKIVADSSFEMCPYLMSYAEMHDRMADAKKHAFLNFVVNMSETEFMEVAKNLLEGKEIS